MTIPRFHTRRTWRWTFTIQRTYDKGKEQEIEKSHLFKALGTTSNYKWIFKGYEDHGLEHFLRIVIRKLVYIFERCFLLENSYVLCLWGLGFLL